LRTNWLIVGIISSPEKTGTARLRETAAPRNLQRARILAGKSTNGQQVIALFRVCRQLTGRLGMRRRFRVALGRF
jgi:hypothetical protein